MGVALAGYGPCMPCHAAVTGRHAMSTSLGAVSNGRTLVFRKRPTGVRPMAVKAFNDAGIELIARILGESLVGWKIDQLLEECKIPNQRDSTKWRRIDSSLRTEQARTRSGTCVVLLLKTVMVPQRWSPPVFDELRRQLNAVLVFDGLSINSQGEVVPRTAARNHAQAAVVSRRLQDGVVSRKGHSEVYKYCRAELLEGDCFGAVFEAVKGLGDRIRDMTGLDADGHRLVERAFEGDNPPVALNSRRNTTEKSEQLGIANLMKGLFSAFRNPPAHEPRVSWHLSEEDALDVLSTLSLIHRRLDGAVVLRRAG